MCSFHSSPLDGHWSILRKKKRENNLSLERYRQVVFWVWTFGMTRMAVNRMPFRNPESGCHFWSGKCSEWKRLMKLSDPYHILLLLPQTLHFCNFAWSDGHLMALLLPQTLHFCVIFSSPFVRNGLKKYWIRGAWPLVQRRIHVCCIHVAWKRFPASALAGGLRGEWFRGGWWWIDD